MKRQKLVNSLLLLWLCCYSGLLYAAAGMTTAQELMQYDWQSFFMAALAGLLGGFLRTILTLASEKRVVLDILRESWKDCLVAVVGGGIVYLILQALSSLNYFVIPRDVRILLIVGAGFSRGRWLGIVEKGANDLVARGRGIVRGDTPPATVPAPLGKD